MEISFLRRLTHRTLKMLRRSPTNLQSKSPIWTKTFRKSSKWWVEIKRFVSSWRQLDQHSDKKLSFVGLHFKSYIWIASSFDDTADWLSVLSISKAQYLFRNYDATSCNLSEQFVRPPNYFRIIYEQTFRRSWIIHGTRQHLSKRPTACVLLSHWCRLSVH